MATDSVTCVQDCPGGLYTTQTLNGTRYCDICSANCATCRDFSYCLSCPGVKLLADGLCVDTCDASAVQVGSVCQSCTSGCQTCSANECLKCAAGFLFERLCVDQCPAGFFGNPRIQQCTACEVACSACTDTYFCTAC